MISAVCEDTQDHFRRRFGRRSAISGIESARLDACAVKRNDRSRRPREILLSNSGARGVSREILTSLAGAAATEGS